VVPRGACALPGSGPPGSRGSVFAGIDDHKDTLAVAGIDAGGRTVTVRQPPGLPHRSSRLPVAGGRRARDRLLRSPADMRSRERDQPTVGAPSVEACVTEGWQAGNGRRAIPCAASCTHGDPIAARPRCAAAEVLLCRPASRAPASLLVLRCRAEPPAVNGRPGSSRLAGGRIVLRHGAASPMTTCHGAPGGG
jgi:hypothetical protein